MATSTLRAISKRLSKREPPEPANRYCCRHPGELIHVDVKKLDRFNRPGHRSTGRGAGRKTRWVAWDARSRTSIQGCTAAVRWSERR